MRCIIPCISIVIVTHGKVPRSGAPPGISRQAPAKMGGYQALWARLWKGQRSGAPPGISRQAPAKMGGYQALWAHPWQGAKVRCASSILRQAQAEGGSAPALSRRASALYGCLGSTWCHARGRERAPMLSRPAKCQEEMHLPFEIWYKLEGTCLYSSVHHQIC
jgi:hypothetical protein